MRWDAHKQPPKALVDGGLPQGWRGFMPDGQPFIAARLVQQGATHGGFATAVPETLVLTPGRDGTWRVDEPTMLPSCGIELGRDGEFNNALDAIAALLRGEPVVEKQGPKVLKLVGSLPPSIGTILVP